MSNEFPAANQRPRAVFLDHDGVINRVMVRDGKPYPPASLAELELLPGVAAALAQLKAAGFWLIVVTNQPDVAGRRHAAAGEVVAAMHATLLAQLPLDEIRVCTHDSGDGCTCRKPQPGMLLAAAAEHGLGPLAASYLVGDRWRDVAGQRAGCTCLFIDYHYAEVCGPLHHLWLWHRWVMRQSGF